MRHVLIVYYCRDQITPLYRNATYIVLAINRNCDQWLGTESSPDLLKAVMGQKHKINLWNPLLARRKNTKKCITLQTSFSENVCVQHNLFMFDHSNSLQILDSRNASVLVVDFWCVQGRVGDKYERQSRKFLWIFRHSNTQYIVSEQRNSFILVTTHFILFMLPTLEFVT